jgi:hypothetical protein
MQETAGPQEHDPATGRASATLEAQLQKSATSCGSLLLSIYWTTSFPSDRQIFARDSQVVNMDFHIVGSRTRGTYM